MDSQILSNLIIAGSTIIAALGGMIVTLWNQNKKSKVDLISKKTDFLYSKLQKLETTISELAKKPEQDEELDIFTQVHNLAVRNYLAFKRISHYIEGAQSVEDKWNSYITAIMQLISPNDSTDLTLAEEDYRLKEVVDEIELLVRKELKKTTKQKEVVDEIELLVRKELKKTTKQIEEIFS